MNASKRRRPPSMVWLGPKPTRRNRPNVIHAAAVRLSSYVLGSQRPLTADSQPVEVRTGRYITVEPVLTGGET
jgi:hypothetical protein